MRKLLIAAVSGVLLLAGVVVVSGLLHPSSNYRAEVTIQAPPAEVYAWLTEPDKLKQWVGGLVDSKPLADQLEPGARSIETIEDEGVRFEMETEAVQVVPNRLLVFRLSAKGDFSFTGVSRYELSEKQGGTLLTLEQEFEYGPFWLRAASPLMTGQVQRKLDADFRKLKSLVETDR